jgi:hypothetical protein
VFDDRFDVGQDVDDLVFLRLEHEHVLALHRLVPELLRFEQDL